MSADNWSRVAVASVVTVAVVVSVFVSWRTMHEEMSTLDGPPLSRPEALEGDRVVEVLDELAEADAHLRLEPAQLLPRALLSSSDPAMQAM